MRLIDADEALRMMRNSKQDNPYDSPKKAIWDVAHVCCISCVDAAPTIEAEPVRHGRWEESGGQLTPMHRCDEFTNPDQIFYGKCSVCGITVYQNGVLNGFNYCPHCGAKMDGKDGEE